MTRPSRVDRPEAGRLHAGRKSFALKRIEVLVTLLGITD